MKSRARQGDPYPYRRPPLTKEFLRGELDASELPIESPDWFEEHDMELRLGCEANAIDPERRHRHRRRLRRFASTRSCSRRAPTPRAPICPVSRPTGADDPRAARQRKHRLPPARDPHGRARDRLHRLRARRIAGGKGRNVTLVGQEPAPQQRRLGATRPPYRGLADRPRRELEDGRRGARRP